MKIAIHWFRRDLRITDNTALTAAARRAESVAPVYILSEWQRKHRWTGSGRQQFLCESLDSLAQNLAAIGGRLIVRQGDAVKELEKLVAETGAEAIFFNRDPDPFGREMEEKVKALARRLRLEIVDCQDVCLHERGEVLTGAGEPFRVFTPYARAWEKLSRRKPVGRLRSLKTPVAIVSQPLPTLKTWNLEPEAKILPGGEKAARARLTQFLKGDLLHYAGQRNALAGCATSRLSQDLRFGLLSIREVYERCEARANEARADVRKFLTELIWREFYMGILWSFPEVLEQEFNPRYRGMDWPGRRAHFQRWRAGETGFPIVDAAMRHLNATGFMPNRARMIVAMFLTKDLQLDWRLGERYFMQKLVDGEIASNNGGWQWSAGVGADAAPYFRIQNPWTQTARFDPEGLYIKEWIPELRDVAPKKFCVPPESRLIESYPPPLVDHAEARARTLELFAGTRRGV